MWTTVGSLVGAVIVYYLGAWLGRNRTRALMVKIPLLKASDFDKSEAWFSETRPEGGIFWSDGAGLSQRDLLARRH